MSPKEVLEVVTQTSVQFKRDRLKVYSVPYIIKSHGSVIAVNRTIIGI